MSFIAVYAFSAGLPGAAPVHDRSCSPSGPGTSRLRPGGPSAWPYYHPRCPSHESQTTSSQLRLSSTKISKLSPGCRAIMAGCEAGIGGLQTRAHCEAARRDRPGEWTCDDVLAAQLSANQQGNIYLHEITLEGQIVNRCSLGHYGGVCGASDGGSLALYAYACTDVSLRRRTPYSFARRHGHSIRNICPACGVCRCSGVSTDLRCLALASYQQKHRIPGLVDFCVLVGHANAIYITRNRAIG
jgi:hypothetical protein